MTDPAQTGLIVGIGAAPQGPGFVTGYVTVSDINATLDKATSLGGSVAFVRAEPNARTLILLLGSQAAALGALDVLYVELAQGVLHRGATVPSVDEPCRWRACGHGRSHDGKVQRSSSTSSTTSPAQTGVYLEIGAPRHRRDRA
jgi:hypothetical protein